MARRMASYSLGSRCDRETSGGAEAGAMICSHGGGWDIQRLTGSGVPKPFNSSAIVRGFSNSP